MYGISVKMCADMCVDLYWECLLLSELKKKKIWNMPINFGKKFSNIKNSLKCAHKISFEFWEFFKF
jgi:hypothetical protein